MPDIHMPPTPVTPGGSATPADWQLYLHAVDVYNRAVGLTQASAAAALQTRVTAEHTQALMTLASVMQDSAASTRTLAGANQAQAEALKAAAAAHVKAVEGMEKPSPINAQATIADLAARLAAEGRPNAQAVADAAEMLRRAALFAPQGS